MSAFTAEKREGKAPGEVVVQEAPSTPVGKETNSGSAEKMAVDGAGEGKPQATPSPVKAAGAKAQGGEAAGAGGKTGSGSKKRAATEASKAAKKAEGKGKTPETGMRTLDMFLKPGGSSNKKAKTGEESTTSPAKENLPPPTRLEMPSGSAKDATEEPTDAGADAAKDEIMIVDDDSQPKATISDDNEAKQHESAPMEVEGAAGRQKLVAQVKPAAGQSNTPAPSAAAAPDAAAAATPAAPAAPDAAKAKKAAPKKAKQVAMSAEEKEKKLKLLNEELSLLSKMLVHGDNIPFLRATEEEEAEELDGVETGDEVLPAKTKQVIARFVEGSAKPAGDLAKSLQAINASAKQMDVEAGAADLACYERAIEAVAEYVEGFYVQEGSSPSDHGVPTFQKIWIVKDVADIPAEYRAIVDAHRKLGASIKERATLATKTVTAIQKGDGKELLKLEKATLSVKDKHVKLEEKEKSEREKYRSKVEAEKKKAADRMEKLLRKEEDSKKKEEEAIRKKEKKEEEQRSREERETKRSEEAAEKAARAAEKAAEKVAEKEKEKDADFEAKPKAAPKKKALPAASAGQATFMSNFFTKKSTGASPSKQSDSAAGSSTSKSTPSKSSTDSSKPHANFRGWEDPAHSTVAGFPYGPGKNDRQAADLPEASIEGWVSKWKSMPARPPIARPTRDDGTLHPVMKIIHVHMRLDVVKTQLIDVDIDAVKKVIWDVEENSEEQLQAILAASAIDEEGLYHWEGKTLQFVTEGGGYFDSRRPAFFGTHVKTSDKFSARNPLGQDPELDYEYESDIDWESETGDGEDLMSDLGEEEEEEEEEDEGGGFVVADGEWDAGVDGVSSRKKVRKLNQIIYDGLTMPDEIADLYSIRVTSELPLMLSRDTNLVIDRGVDYTGGDLGNFKAETLEEVMAGLHKHQTACAFTWVDPKSDNRFAGVCFLKTRDSAEDKHPDQEHLISGHLSVVPHWKKDAINREKQQEFAAELERQRLAAIAAAEKAAAEKKAQRSMSALQKKPIEEQLSEEQLKGLITSVHGSPRVKQQVVELVHKACGLTKAVSSALVSRVASRKEHRWRINAPFLESKQLLDASEEAWETNCKEAIPAKQPKQTEAQAAADASEAEDGSKDEEMTDAPQPAAEQLASMVAV